MTDTVDAIGYRADVKTRAKEAVVEAKDGMIDKAHGVVSRVTGAMPNPSAVAGSVAGAGSSVASTAGGAGSTVVSAVGDAVPSRQQVRQAASVAQSNPLGLAIGSAAVGFVLGMLIPSSRAEDERFGELSDQVKEQARDLGAQAVEHGKEIAQETARSAGETVQQQGQQHGRELAESLQEATRETAASAGGGA